MARQYKRTKGKERKSISAEKYHSNAVLDKYQITKEWGTNYKMDTFDIDEVNYRIQNDLPIEPLYLERDGKYLRTGKFKKQKNNGEENL